MTRFLRFVKSAHFFAFTIACIFGVFFATNLFAAVYCNDSSTNAYRQAASNEYKGPTGKCRTCPPTSYTPTDNDFYYWGDTCGNGNFTCIGGGVRTQFVSKGGPNDPDYHCANMCTYSSACDVSGWSWNCNEVSGIYGLNGCRLRQTNTSATGCITNGNNNWLVKERKLNYSNTTYFGSSAGDFSNYDAATGKYWGAMNSSAWSSTITYADHSSMPGYTTQITNGTCTKCTGNTFSPGDVDKCLTCPYGGSPTPVTSPSSNVRGASSYDLWREGLYLDQYGNLALATPGASSSDGTYCVISTTLSDDSGTYNTGTCTLSASSLSDMLWYYYYVTLDLTSDEAGEWIYNLCYARFGGNPTGQRCWDVDGTEGENLLKDAIWTISGTNCDQDSFVVVRNNDVLDYIEFICRSVGDIQKVMGGTNMSIYMFTQLYED